MSWASAVVAYSLPFLGVVLVITLVHELGHFIVARWCGVRVEAFSVGFGRELLGFTDRHGTRFKLCLLPLGGYVKMFGEQGFMRDAKGRIRLLERHERERSFFHKSIRQRAAIVFAGPLVNVVFGAAVLALLFLLIGLPSPSPTIGKVLADSPAAAAGLQAGDRILAVDGEPAQRMDWILDAAARDADRVLALDVRRGEREVRLVVDLRGLPEGAGLGITSAGAERVAIDPVTAVGESIRMTSGFVVASVTGIAEIVSGQRRLDDLAGPVRIAEVSGKVFVERGVIAVIVLMAVLSVNVGIVHLLPIPVLDGGHLVFLGIEAVRSRPLSPRVLKFCSLGGLAALLVIFVLTTGHDLSRLGLFSLD
ncbi:MAG: M50 family metallopeptidase [Dongiaceae bacterium]